LRVIEAERSTSKESRPDFLPIDAEDSEILIECKGKATKDACYQLFRYGRNRRNARMLLVVFGFDKECRRLTKRKGIELVEAQVHFKRA
jgi:RecB family endonuclease NucS